jgi:hypothetical protein
MRELYNCLLREGFMYRIENDGKSFSLPVKKVSDPQGVLCGKK